jgi:LCP family protein required for cell wall assembly
MIENELRAAFTRQEHLVPDASRLVPAIDATARRRRGRRQLLRSGTAAAAVLVMALATALAVPALAPRLTARPALLAPPHDGQPQPRNYLVAGLDGGAGQTEPLRSDTIIIAHVPADRSAIYFVTIPRDTGAEIPGHGTGRINSAYSFGGFALLAQTVTARTGIAFNGGATVDYAGLVSIVDTLGGINYCVDQRTTSYHTHRVYEPGCRLFSGAEIKDYLRQRMGLPNGAFDRDRHNAQFLGAVVAQLRSNTFTDPRKVAALFDALRSYVVLDTRGDSPADLAWQLRGAFGTVVGIGMPTAPNGGQALLEPAPSAADLFNALRADTVSDWLKANPAAAIRLS